MGHIYKCGVRWVKSFKLNEGTCFNSVFDGQALGSYVISEDIFVFKSVTSRERDREDMYLLFLQGLNFEVIRNEIIRQILSDKIQTFPYFRNFSPYNLSPHVIALSPI